jgi:hypothetical protein
MKAKLQLPSLVAGEQLRIQFVFVAPLGRLRRTCHVAQEELEKVSYVETDLRSHSNASED